MLSLTVRQKLKHNLIQMNLLQSFMYPEYRDAAGGATTIKSAPLLRVKLANLICDAQTGGPLLCYTQQVSFDPDFNTYGAFMDGANLIPKMYTVTLSLNILHEHTLGWGTNGFGNGIGDNFPRRFGDHNHHQPTGAKEDNRSGGALRQAHQQRLIPMQMVSPQDNREPRSSAKPQQTNC